MRIQKSATIKKNIQDWTMKQQKLRADLEQAERVEAEAEQKRKNIVLMAKVGSEKAQKELAKLNDSWFLAGREREDLRIAVTECEGKLNTLRNESAEAHQRELREQYERGFREILALTPAIDRIVVELLELYEKALALARPMGEILEFIEDTRGVKLRRPYLSLRRTLSAHLVMHLRLLNFDHVEGAGLENISTFLRDGQVKPLAEILSPEETAEEHEKPQTRRETAA
ncbi:hypothetical protein MYX84_00760 [Acidobacteria bacterium AH-259-O06]|nr:hypothetical protein [Acidobacteria bacterium AH-259-O06]